MLLTLSAVLSPEALAEVREALDAVDWYDGRRTAGGRARSVKRNQQADLTSPNGAKLRQALRDAIEKHPVFRAAAQPRRMSRLMVSRTQAGGGYGLHVDNALMGSGSERLRTDLSFTLFLSPPDGYDGGELTIEAAGQQHRLKPDAGDLILYPSTSLHRVEEVTRGERLVCVGWVESLVREGDRRDVLFDLENLRASLAERLEGDAPERLVLDKVVSNLLRMWADV